MMHHGFTLSTVHIYCSDEMVFFYNVHTRTQVSKEEIESFVDETRASIRSREVSSVECSARLGIKTSYLFEDLARDLLRAELKIPMDTYSLDVIDK